MDAELSRIMMLNDLFEGEETRRDSLQIYADIVAVCTEPSKITKIIRMANVQYRFLQRALDLLLEAGLIRKMLPTYRDERTSREFATTELGLRWRRTVCSVYDALHKVG